MLTFFFYIRIAQILINVKDHKFCLCKE